jgi:hypothetical protein
MVPALIPGNNHNKSGSMIREECWKELGSPDAEKMSSIHAITGSQFQMSSLSRDTLVMEEQIIQ